MIGSPLIVKPSASARSRARAGLPRSLSCPSPETSITRRSAGMGSAASSAALKSIAAASPVPPGTQWRSALSASMRKGFEVQARPDQPPGDCDGLAVPARPLNERQHDPPVTSGCDGIKKRRIAQGKSDAIHLHAEIGRIDAARAVYRQHEGQIDRCRGLGMQLSAALGSPETCTGWRFASHPIDGANTVSQLQRRSGPAVRLRRQHAKVSDEPGAAPIASGVYRRSSRGSEREKGA